MKVAGPQYFYAILDPASSFKDNFHPRGFGFLFQMDQSSFDPSDNATTTWAENCAARCVAPSLPVRQA